jgi:hypothetical protein
MSTVEKISLHVRALPEQLQDEVLDFVEFLKSKSELDDENDDRGWNEFSLAQAMRGMEDEDWPEISEEDIKR